jgi:hypothetical protein
MAFKNLNHSLTLHNPQEISKDVKLMNWYTTIRDYLLENTNTLEKRFLTKDTFLILFVDVLYKFYANSFYFILKERNFKNLKTNKLFIYSYSNLWNDLHDHFHTRLHDHMSINIADPFLISFKGLNDLELRRELSEIMSFIPTLIEHLSSFLSSDPMYTCLKEYALLKVERFQNRSNADLLIRTRENYYEREEVLFKQYGTLYKEYLTTNFEQTYKRIYLNTLVKQKRSSTEDLSKFLFFVIYSKFKDTNLLFLNYFFISNSDTFFNKENNFKIGHNISNTELNNFDKELNSETLVTKETFKARLIECFSYYL